MNGALLLGPGMDERFRGELEELDYIVHSAELVTSIDDIAAAVLALKQLTPGAIAALAVGPAATLLLAAATVLPQLDAIVLFGGSLPASRPHYARMRVQVLVHRAEQGSAMSAEDVTSLREEAAAGQVLVLDWAYPTANDGFAVEPASDRDEAEATIAWDRTRDFLDTALPDIATV